MAMVFSAQNKVVVLQGDKFHECIALEAGSGIKVEPDGDGVIIFFEDEGFHKECIHYHETMAEISFVLIDPTQEVSKQIVGIAERDDFDESSPGRVYLLQ